MQESPSGADRTVTYDRSVGHNFAQAELFEVADEAQSAHVLDHEPELLKALETSARGAPRTSIEAILEVADPPRYTPCPSPFLGEWVGRRPRSDGPDGVWPPAAYEGALDPGPTHPVHAFHPYHTKVPPRVIQTLIEHYTRPGELVLDVFAGSGMTGVAARDAGRDALLIDLSPIATFIESVNCAPHPGRRAAEEMTSIIATSRDRYGHLYGTDGGLEVNYFVWTDVFTCPACEQAFPFMPYGVVHHGTKVETRRSFPCPHCEAELSVRKISRVVEDGRKARALAWVNAGSGTARVNRPPTDLDLDLAERVVQMSPTSWYPRDPVDPDAYSAKLAQLGDKQITDVSAFLSPRNLIVFADLWERVGQISDRPVRRLCRALLTSIFTVISERQGYFGGGGGMSGNLYMPIVRMEKNVYDVLTRKLPRMLQAEQAKRAGSGEVFISTQSATALDDVPDESVDYAYLDPPFGSNIIYSEMNLVLEAWLGVRTDESEEAVVDSTRGRGLAEYASMLRACLEEVHRVLKPGRWLTVEFHNTQAEVWHAIQRAIVDSRFVVAQVSVLDKGSTTILGDIRPNAAKHDLVISAFKGTAVARDDSAASDVWQFVAARLSDLPVGDNERTKEKLFGRMVAAHVKRGARVPMSAEEFYAGLSERFLERGSMFFAPGEHVADEARLRFAE
jgi:16S rRNA G966 N2-methylase RsmD